MFLGTLFIIVKIWKQPKCPSRAEWMKKMLCIHDTHTNTHTHQEYYTAVKKTERMPFAATRMYLEIIILNEMSRQRNTNIMLSFICGI